MPKELPTNSNLLKARERIAQKVFENEKTNLENSREFWVSFKKYVEPQILSIKSTFLLEIPERLFEVIDEVGGVLDILRKKEYWEFWDKEGCIYSTEEFHKRWKMNTLENADFNIHYQMDYEVKHNDLGGEFQTNLYKTKGKYYFSLDAPNTRVHPIFTVEFDKDREKTVDLIAEKLVLMIDNKEYEYPSTGGGNDNMPEGGF